MTQTEALERMGKDEVYELAKERDIAGRSNMDKEELVSDSLRMISLRMIDVVQFVDHGEIDPISFERSYYVAPEKGGVKAYLRASVEATKDRKSA